MEPWETYLNEHSEQFLNELLDFLRIPSISSLTDQTKYVRQAAEWVAARLQTAGMNSIRIMPTGGHPVVYGDWLHASNKPTVLIYGHFDTQPVDPLDLWDNPPFEPVIREDRIYARGASDDKGNLFIPIIVAEAMLKTAATLPVNIKFLFEGQEEIGSPQLSDFISQNRDLLSCDLAINADGGQWEEDQPAVILGTRGLAAIYLDIQGPEHDLHSGTYGGTIVNPIHALVQILDSMHDQDGQVTVDGFYDTVQSLSNEERAQLARVPFDETAYLVEVGSPGIYGESGFTTYERAWARPTLEINGIWGGFQGEGLKTVLPSTAHAKISCRLVANQDPEIIADLVVAHVKKVCPPGVQITVTKGDSKAIPYLVSSDERGMRIATSVLTELYGKEPYQIRMGGTIPVNALFLEYLNVYTIVFSFGLQDERQHSPNEFFRLSSFERGQKAYGMFLNRLGEEL